MSKYYILAFLVSFCVLSNSAIAGQSLSRVEGAPDVTNLQPAIGVVPHLGTLRIGLSLKNIDSAGSDAFVASQYDPNSSNFHKWIDDAEFGRRFGAPQSDISVITKYLKANGFTNITVSATKIFISADATVGSAEKAFNTKIGFFQRPSNQVVKGEPLTTFAPTKPLRLPASLASKISAIHGLTDLLVQHHHSGFKLKPQGITSTGGYTPYDLSTAYVTDWLHSRGYYGQGMNIGVYSPTQWTKSDVDTFATSATADASNYPNGYAISGYTILQTPIDGGATDAGGSDEAALDAEVVVGQAPKATVNMLMCSSSSDTGEIDSFNKALALKYPIVTSSWGLDENTIIQSGLQSFATDFNNTMKTLASAGISVFIASGDDGAYGDGGTVICTGMESSSQYVTAVGGTNLAINPNTSAWAGETAWSYTTPPQSGGGGGLSELFTRPSWQTGPGVSNQYSNGMREVPDVAANGDPGSGYSIYSTADKGWGVVGGTSASTPLWASNVLLINQYLKTNAGFLSPALYTFGTEFENPAVDLSNDFYLYHDITSGSNGAVSATKSWDYCTGWGSANFFKLLTDLGSYLKFTGIGPDFVAFNPHSESGFSVWTSPMMIHSSTTSVVEPTTFTHGVTLYFAVSMANTGYADGPASTETLYIDNVAVATHVFPAIEPSGFDYSNNIYSTKLGAGPHTIKLVCNSGNTLHETNYTNDSYSRTIDVS